VGPTTSGTATAAEACAVGRDGGQARGSSWARKWVADEAGAQPARGKLPVPGTAARSLATAGGPPPWGGAAATLEQRRKP
jgi:hypothetical protein